MIGVRVDLPRLLLRGAKGGGFGCARCPVRVKMLHQAGGSAVIGGPETCGDGMRSRCQKAAHQPEQFLSRLHERTPV